ncbi:uncharacterized protein N7483_008272 [Penicillium malachiteum]|uniref:uncharacterized protein n=1 Tax=Penicillium malachiteum TaxID=1324776 RepID=UPI00254748B6|nr:uncharacterized protein N7483_008272 [Penicillium malachiteum]KAJ5720338.1 hypothetical protein N7483_008272 [Penicillium malachiteum]
MPQNAPPRPDRMSGNLKDSEVFKTKLLKICDEWIDWGHEIKCYDFVTNLANALHEHEKGKDGSAEDIGEWATDFRNQRPEFQKRIDDARAQSRKDKETVAKGWISMVRRLTRKYHIDPEDMYAVREIGYFTSKSGNRRSVTLVRPSHEKLAALQTGRSMASAIHCFSGAGKILVPWVMTQAKDPSPYVTISEIQVASNLTGWASIMEWKSWLHESFEPETRKPPRESSRWRLMLVNGYQTPFDESCFLFCREHKILCISYPRTCRQDLDPFHVRVFPTIEEKYRRWIYLRWEQSKKAEVRLDTRTFSGILSKISFAGLETEKNERRVEAEKAWKSYTILIGPMGSTVKTHLTSNTGCWKNRGDECRTSDIVNKSTRNSQAVRSQESDNQNGNQETVPPTLNEGIATFQANVNLPSNDQEASEPLPNVHTPSNDDGNAKEDNSKENTPAKSSDQKCQISVSKAVETQVASDKRIRSPYWPQPSPSARKATIAQEKVPLIPLDSGGLNVEGSVSMSGRQVRSLSSSDKQMPPAPKDKGPVSTFGQKLEQSTLSLVKDDLPTESQGTNPLALRPKGSSQSLDQRSGTKRSVDNPFDTYDKAMKRIRIMPEDKQGALENRLNSWLDQVISSSSFGPELNEES